MLLKKLQFSGQPSLKDRLHAWWEGYYLDEIESDETDSDDGQVHPRPTPREEPKTPEPEPSPPKRAPEIPPSEVWNEARIALNELIWGSGYVAPGDDDVITDLIAPLGLTTEHSAVHLGAGIGGATRCIAETTGAWVAGYEEDPALAAAGAERSNMAGMAKRAPIHHARLETLKIRRRSVDAVFSKESLFTIPDKKHVLEAVRNMLKLEGQVLLTDFVSAEQSDADPQVESWLHKEPVKPTLWAAEEYQGILEELGFEVRVTEDISTAYAERVVAGFKRLLERMRQGPLDPDLNQIVVREAEHWAERISVLESGAVKVYRFYGRIPLRA